MNFTIKGYCHHCDDTCEIEMKERFERWMDFTIDDDDLTESEVISRMNGDVLRIYTCVNCHNSWEEL